MSTIEVNTIKSISGTSTLTIGESGDTIALTSGAKTSGFGKIGQILQSSTTTTTSVTSTSYVDVGLSQAMTPSTTSSKILVIAFCSGGSASSAGASGDDAFVALARDIGGAGYSNIGGGGNVASDAFIHWSAGNGSSQSYNDMQWSIQKGTFLYLDSPASTSECTYKLQQKNRNASKQTYFNRRGGDTLSSISYLTLMEILD